MSADPKQTTATPVLYARRYASIGWPAFPCQPDAKGPIQKGGFHNATTDEAQISAHWRSYPRANVGLRAGIAFWVLDVDPRHGGDDALAALEAKHGPLPDTLRASTPSGGTHFYFAPDSRARNTASKLGAGLDTRGHGGYVLAEGSTVGGKRYGFLDWDPLTDDAPALAVAPGWLTDEAFVKADPSPGPSTTGDRIPEGKRNEELSRLAYKLRKSGLAIETIEAAVLAENARRCDPPLPDDEVREIARGKGGVAPDAPPVEIIVGPDLARLRGDLFDAPPKAFPMIVEGVLPQDVGTEPAAGGVGKTTRHLYESAQIILERDLWGYKVLKGGPVVIVTAEDFRALYEERLYHIALACRFSPVERRRLLDNIYIEDVVGKDAHLVRADPGGNLYPTPLVDTIIEKYRGRGVALVEFDPLNLLGPGERFINDGESSTISAVRPISYELQCAVRLTHHVSKAVFRDRVVDMYAGRGGASSADNARFVWVSVTHSTEDDKAYPPPTGTEEAIANKRLARIHFAKVSYVPPHPRPIWVERDGYTYRRLEDPEKETAEEVTDRQIKVVVDFVTAELAGGVRHTSRTLEDAKAAIGLARDAVRILVHKAIQKGRLVRVDLAEGEKRGRKDYYLKPGYPRDGRALDPE